METVVTLEPRNDPNEILVNGLEQRKQLELRGTADSPQSLVLGRGSFTGIGDNSIGSSVLMISLEWFEDEPVLRATLSRDAKMCKVHYNGRPFPSELKKMVLSSGDLISLDGLRYEYKIHISEVSRAASAPGSDPLGGDLGLDSDDFWDANSHLESSPGTKSDGEVGVSVSKTACSQLSDEVHCSVCLEIQVNSRSIHPCGHSVCAICITRLKECPQCRVKINSHIPNMQLDSLIEKLISIPSLLDAEDIKGYHERKKTAKVFPAVDLTPMSGSKRRRFSSSTRHRQGGGRSPREQILQRINSGAQRIPASAVAASAMSFAFGDYEDEFYMPPHLGPAAAAAARSRAVSTAAAGSSGPRSNRLRSFEEIMADHHAMLGNPYANDRPPRSRHASSSSRRTAPARQARPAQAAVQPAPRPREGTSLENAISID